VDHKAFLAAVPVEERLRLTGTSDRAGLWHLAGHLGAILLVGGLIVARVPGWGFLLPVQGVLVVFLFTLEHECTHRTPFRSRWINEGVGHVCGVLLVLPFRWFRAFHLAHHRWTNIAGRDPELEGGKPEGLWGWVVHVSGGPYWRSQVALVWRLATGGPVGEYVAEGAVGGVRREARAMLAVYAVVAVTLWWSPVLLWVWIVPVLLGQPVLRLYLLAEHGDCPQVADMFLNTRTTFTTAMVRFLAWNMPYHAEHHVWPAVPFHQLPALHGRMRAHLGVTADGYVAFNRAYLARRLWRA
jgi:fatty acid desaturase